MAEDGHLERPTTEQLFAEDHRRARELYRHVQPHHLLPPSKEGSPSQRNVGATPPSLRDALEPYVQLAALRCNAQRAFITLMDRESQYFVAEASKIVDTDTGNIFEKHAQLLWLDCEGIPKSGKLCEMTIQLPPVVDPYPVFEVKNLAEDPRFCELPFVKGEPFFRFYAGTPLTTKRGINIGTICVMDVTQRDGLDREQTSVLGWLASLTITFLETHREAVEGRRSKSMSDALNAFVDGQNRMQGASSDNSKSRPQQDRAMLQRTPRTVPHENRSEPATNSQETSASAMDPVFNGVFGATGDPKPLSKDRMTTSSDPSSDEEDFRGKAQDGAVSQSHRFTFSRAANILRECFELTAGDGVLFLEVGSDLTYTTGSNFAMSTNQEAHEVENIVDSPANDPISPVHQVGTNTAYDPLIGAFTKQVKCPVPVLAFSTEDEPFMRGQFPLGRAALGDIDREVLRELLKRHPNGKIWTLGGGSVNSSSEDDQGRKNAHGNPSQRLRRAQARKVEVAVLAKQFPEARQVIFAPLWDAGASRWASGCFMWSSSETYPFSTSIELSFLNSFGKTIMVECSRLDTLLADKQKADFIGSISHELRSPLHGILAGAEFLSETAANAFQRSLIATVEACGRTLLDTINHVLDFSKINSLDRNWRNNGQQKRRPTEGQIGPGAQISTKQLPGGAPPLLRLYAVTDIAAITEEVIEGLSIGQIYSQASDLTDTSASNRGHGGEKGRLKEAGTHGGREDGINTGPDAIEVLLDISKEDWVFTTQPGAIRRIIMNLFGNSIKYTTSGTIKVQLRLEDVQRSDSDHDGRLMVLTITDTGKGISAKFLSSRLFVPFAQENTLSPGTGLGLSIVRSIVTMLGGNIDLWSQIGEGTTVQVSLPLMRPSRGQAVALSSSPSISPGQTSDDSVQLLCSEASGCTVAINGHSEEAGMSIRSRKYAQVLARYVRDWYGLNLRDWADRGQAKVLIIEERDLAEILKEEVKAGLDGHRALIVLCSNATRQSEAAADTPDLQATAGLEYLSKPCGPYKLARALRRAVASVQLVKSRDSTETQEMLKSPDVKNSKELSLTALPEEERLPHLQGDQPMLESNSTQERVTGQDRSTDEKLDTSKGPSPETFNNIASTLPPEVQEPSNGTNKGIGRFGRHHFEGTALRTLLVDDNNINLQLLHAFMRKLKYDFVELAKDGSIAVDAVKRAEEPYDVIFMDISMPVMNGFQATREIRRFEVDNKLKPAMIIALTGLANGRDQAEGFSSGCDIYMTKPVSFKELAKLLRNWEGNMDAVRNPDEYNFVTMRGGLAKEGDAYHQTREWAF